MTKVTGERLAKLRAALIKARSAPRSYTPLKKSRDEMRLQGKGYFLRGKFYFAPMMSGQDPSTKYKCVYVGKDIVVFIFIYQGIERVHTAYKSTVRAGDFVTVNSTSKQKFKPLKEQTT